MRLWQGVVVCLLLVGLAGCSSSEQKSASKPTGGKVTAAKRAPKAFKGMELYAWKPEGKDWHFSVLNGTNCNKWLSEVTDPKNVIVGVDNVKKRLTTLAKGERVFWIGLPSDENGKNTRKSLSAPSVPKELVEDLNAFCRSQKITLSCLGT